MKQLFFCLVVLLSGFKNFAYNFGFSQEMNERKHQEDYGMICRNNDQNVEIFGIFDGHNGTETAEFASENLHNNLLNNLAKSRMLGLENKEESIVKGAFIKTHNDFYVSHPDSEAGSTAVVVVIDKTNDNIIVGNVGDSRAVLCSNGKAIDLSVDQKPSRPDEKIRIEKCHGKVEYCYGAWRVESDLAMSRALGDRRLSPFVIPLPEVTQRIKEKNDEFIIIASDGLWDAISSEYVVKIVKEGKKRNYSLNQIADWLVAEAIDLKSDDNITVLIIDLQS